ncbi:hypothetical protein JMJ77_0002869, partial [Colletotrichum scovillei]
LLCPSASFPSLHFSHVCFVASCSSIIPYYQTDKSDLPDTLQNFLPHFSNQATDHPPPPSALAPQNI